MVLQFKMNIGKKLFFLTEVSLLKDCISAKTIEMKLRRGVIGKKIVAFISPLGAASRRGSFVAKVCEKE